MKNKKVLFTSICNDPFVEGEMVMLYSMKKNIPNFLEHSHKIFYNDVFCKLSDENKEKIRKIIPNMQFDNIQQPSYDTANIVFEHGRPPLLTLEAFNQPDYDVVCKFDNDMLCINDITDVLSMDGDLVGVGKGKTMNCGFFVVNKKVLNDGNYYDGLIKFVDSWKHREPVRMNDQAAVNSSGVFSGVEWTHPSDDYNYRGKVNIPKFDNTMTNVKILHWSGYMHEAHERFPKPWDENPIGCYAQDLWEKSKKEMNEELY